MSYYNTYVKLWLDGWQETWTDFDFSHQREGSNLVNFQSSLYSLFMLFMLRVEAISGLRE